MVLSEIRQQYVFKDPFSAFPSGLFAENCGALSQDHGTRFDHDISAKEKKYQCKWMSSMLEDYCWTVTRDSPGLMYKRQAKWRRASSRQVSQYTLWHGYSVYGMWSVTQFILDNVAKPFMGICVFSIPESIKRNTFHLRSKKISHNLFYSLIDDYSARYNL